MIMSKNLIISKIFKLVIPVFAILIISSARAYNKSTNINNYNTKSKIVNLVFKDNKFNPQVIKLKPNTKYTLVIDNQDKEDNEFDSEDLKYEKFMHANSKVSVDIGPLKSGSYEFAAEMSANSKGKILVK